LGVKGGYCPLRANRRGSSGTACENVLHRKQKLCLELSPGGFRYGTITLEIAPWISAKTVEAACRDAKRQVYRNRKYRQLKEKSLKMIRFVAGYDKPPKGRRPLEAWNATEWVEKNPTWYYGPRLTWGVEPLLEGLPPSPACSGL
jgi:hypothetical protein